MRSLCRLRYTFARCTRASAARLHTALPLAPAGVVLAGAPRCTTLMASGVPCRLPRASVRWLRTCELRATSLSHPRSLPPPCLSRVAGTGSCPLPISPVHQTPPRPARVRGCCRCLPVPHLSPRHTACLATAYRGPALSGVYLRIAIEFLSISYISWFGTDWPTGRPSTASR